MAIRLKTLALLTKFVAPQISRLSGLPARRKFTLTSLCLTLLISQAIPFSTALPSDRQRIGASSDSTDSGGGQEPAPSQGIEDEKKKGKRKNLEKDLEKLSKDKNGQSTDPYGNAPCVSWVDPRTKPRLCLLCIHGLGLYSGSYMNFGKWMARHGIATYAIDVRGFGSWMKAQGHEEVDFAACLNDIKKTLQSLRAANPGVPIFLLGESMGGAIALRATAMYPDLIDGLISSVPAGERFKQKKTDLKVALEFLTGPNRQHNIGKSVVAQATKNEKLREDWEENPLDRMDLSAKELIQFQRFMNENHDVAKQIIKTPVLMVQGSKDKLVKPEGTWELFNEQATEEKVFLAVPSEHLIFEEQQDHGIKFDERVSRLVLTWMFEHVPDGYKVAENAPGDATSAIALLFGGKIQAAKQELDSLIVANPNDDKAHFWRGIAWTKLNHPAEARADFAKAISFGKGGVPAKKANEYMLAMFANSKPTDPAPGPQQAGGVSLPADLLRQAGVDAGVPAVLAFYAPWAEQCADIDQRIIGGRKIFGQKLKVVKIDIEDKQWEDLIKACNVGPIPTFVFVSASGQIAFTSIGMNNFIDFANLAKSSSNTNTLIK